jgi:hypothetical protein
LPKSGTNYIAHDYFIDFGSIYASLAERCGYGVSAKLWRLLVRQHSLKTTHGRTRCANNINL